jgi:N-acetylglutamate synthase-like GNAT family acetyltransferase
MIIRKANKKDVENIITVIKESVLGTHQELYPKRDIEETLNNYTKEKVLKYIKESDYFVVEDNGEIIGCVLVKENKMRSLYVLPSHMGKGLGKKLVLKAEDCVREKEYEKIWLWASLVAHDFYKHMGYKDIKDIPNEDGLVLHIEMEKYL